MPFGVPDYVFAGLVLFAIGSGMGALAMWLPHYIRWNVGNFRIAEIYDERPGGFYMIRRVRISLGAQSFTVGKDYEFIVPTPAPVVLYNGSHGVLHYVLDKARPRHLKVGERAKVKPETVAVQVPPNVPGNKKANGKYENPDTESRSVHLWQKRGFLRQALASTNPASIKSMLPLIILASVAAFFIAFVVFQQWHPGFVQAPPAGYYYKVCQVVTNSNGTVIQGVGGCAP